MSSDNILKIREKITKIDSDIIELLHQRDLLIDDIANDKILTGKPIRDIDRERDLFASLVNLSAEKKYNLRPQYIKEIFNSIVKESLLKQQTILELSTNEDDKQDEISISYLGIEGSYSYFAALDYANIRGKKLNSFPCESFKANFNAVISGRANYAILPIENTSSGSINEVYDLLIDTNLTVVGELPYKINHALLSKNKIDFSKVKYIYSHPQPISQCSDFIENNLSHAEIIFTASTSHASKIIAESNCSHSVAIANLESAKLFGLYSNIDSIANNEYNYTRFIILAKKPLPYNKQAINKTIIQFTTSQQPGSLANILNIFKKYNITLVKLESRPLIDNIWQENFFVELLGHQLETGVKQSLIEAKEFAYEFKVIGSYISYLILPSV